MLVVVGYTDTPTRIRPGDWDQILHLSKATQHQRHSNEEVFCCKLSFRGCASVCSHLCEFVFVPEKGKEVTKEENRGVRKAKDSKGMWCQRGGIHGSPQHLRCLVIHLLILFTFKETGLGKFPGEDSGPTAGSLLQADIDFIFFFVSPSEEWMTYRFGTSWKNYREQLPNLSIC